MCRNLSFLISVVLVLSLASTSFSAVDVVIGNWESTMESWSACGWGPPGNATLTPGQTTGVTLGSGSLEASGQAIGPEPLYWFIQINDSTGFSNANFIANDIFAVDVTRVASDWTPLPDPCEKSSTIGVQIQCNADGAEIVRVDGLVPWDGITSTQTLYVDYSVANPGGTPSWKQLTLNTETSGYTAGGVYYLDNARLLRSTLATRPAPKDGATDVLSNAILKWKPGRYADKHDVYFGTDFNDVNDANSSWPVATGPDDPNVYKGRKDPNTYDPGGLDTGQTYYWRIDEVNAAPDYTIYKGNIWSFSVVSYYAWNPSPPDGTIYVPTYVQPRWNAGVAATEHRMYFGTDYNGVNDVPVGDTSPPLYKGYSTDTIWGNEGTELGLGITDYNTIYYWRIDEANDTTTWKGDVWQFTSAFPGGTVVIGDWEDVNDGWWLVDATSSSYSTTGVTLHNKSFKLEIPGGDWNNAMGVGVNEVDIKSNDTFKIDVTWIASEWSGVGDAQILGLVINAAGIDWTELGPPDTDTSNPTEPGVWNPGFGDDTRTLSWDYSDVNTLDDIPNGGWMQLAILTSHHLSYGTGTYYFDNARLFDSRFASNPDPRNAATDVPIDPVLSWAPGKFADKHDVYFGTDEDAVTDANRTSQLGVLIKQDYGTNSIDIANDVNVGLLAFDTTYYWRIDEVNDTGPDPCLWKGNVWRFMTGHYLIIDDFELYNPNLDDTWKASSKATVNLSTDPVYGGAQAMAIDYDNNVPPPYYSEAYADTTGPNSLDFGIDWTVGGVEGLSLWFKGIPDLRGSFSGSDPYTLEGDGWDIEETSDGFHYAYKQLAAATWQIVAKVVSVENTDPWAKAGVMVRETLEPNSIHASIFVTPENGVLFEWREVADGNSESTQAPDANITPQHWVRLTRGAAISAEHANDVGGDPDKWTQVGDTLDLELTGVGTPIYIGLCVTSHNELELCTAEISNVSMQAPLGTPLVGPWADKDIGIPYNYPEPMYVVLEDSNSDDGIVYYEDKDPNATQKGIWTHWGIELDEFSAQDVDLTDVQRMYIGFGDLNDPAPGGTGTVHFDDIRLYALGCVLSNRTAGFAKADYAPEGSPSGDCVVDYREIGIMERDWLKSPPPNPAVDLHVDNMIDFKDFAALAEFWLEEQMSLWP